MSAFAKAPRLPRNQAVRDVRDDDDYIGRAVEALDAAAAARAENLVFREPEREKPTSVALTVAGGIVLALVIYLIWCGMYALLGGVS